ncbi:sulfatase [Planctomicrobium piriforme]|uniref:Arylsulfatase A n=1 Tax=Planctomicrobium piriforme TaxID=1576369 RepID=A0A1I3KWT5_9PLAN|nr:sulfatase [Planctomicrobium piriforme]SFI76962.1 Arylsulfatase A [Planctomicrobium piriforme]
MARAFSVFIALALLWGHSLQAAERPNIVMIVVDDLNDWVGCLEGHPQVQTPHMDALAGRGTLFTNAHCQAPLCNPSRTSVLTGRRPSSTGIYALEPWLRESPVLKDCVTLPQYFKQNGYRTLTAGKIFHAGWPPKPERASYYDVWGPTSSHRDKPAKKIVAAPTPDGNHPAVDWGTFPHRDEDKGDYILASWAVEQLQSKPAEPFFLSVGFSLPHVPCYATQQWFDLYPADTLILPTVPTSDRSDVPNFAWRLNWKLPEPRLSWLQQNKEWENLVRAYLASTSFVDSQIGRVVDAVSAQGLAEKSIIVLWSDHGWHLGEKGITGKNSLWRESTRVPLMFAGPGIAQGICREPVELLDLYPTLCELCSLPVPVQLEGHSLAPQLKDSRTSRPWPAITTQSPNNHSVVTRDWRYIRYADGSDELYDTTADRREWTNLANDPAYAEQKRSLAKWLPVDSAPPAPGSKSRLLEQREGVWYWQGEAMNLDEPRE